MYLAEISQHVFAQTQRSRTAGVIIGRRVKGNLRVFKRPVGGGNRSQRIGLGVKYVISARRTVPILFCRHATANACRDLILFARLASVKFRSDLKQSNVAISARRIILNRQQQIRQNRRTHLIQICSNRIKKQNRFSALAKILGQI